MLRKLMSATVLALIGLTLWGSQASAQVLPYPVNPAQADACYGLTQLYGQTGNPALVRIAADVGCVAVPAVVPVPVAVAVPVAVGMPTYFGQQFPTVATYVGQRYTAHPHRHRHLHHTGFVVR